MFVVRVSSVYETRARRRSNTQRSVRRNPECVQHPAQCSAQSRMCPTPSTVFSAIQNVLNTQPSVRRDPECVEHPAQYSALSVMCYTPITMFCSIQNVSHPQPSIRLDPECVSHTAHLSLLHILRCPRLTPLISSLPTQTSTHI